MKLVFYIVLGVCAYFDIKQRKIPTVIVFVALTISLIQLFMYFNIYSAMFSIAIVLMGIALKHSIGRADVLLLIATVFMFKPAVFVKGILFACIVAVIYAFILKKTKITSDEVPFIPFLLIGLLISHVQG